MVFLQLLFLKMSGEKKAYHIFQCDMLALDLHCETIAHEDKNLHAVLPLQDQPQRGVTKMAWQPHAYPSTVQRKQRETYLLRTGIYFGVFY